MILLIDAGNSYLKWNLQESGSDEFLNTTRQIAHREQNFADQLHDHWHALEGLTEIWLANVAGKQVAETIEFYAQQHWGLKPQIAITGQHQAGVNNAYSDHTQLGVDRWLTLLAAHRLFPGQAVCIIDCGTALTADLMTGRGQHEGGLIIPGTELMKNVLTLETDAIDITNNQKNGDETRAPAATVWGHNTRDCIQQGISIAGIAFIRQAIASAEKHLGKPVTVLITGGAASEYLSELPEDCQHKQDLVLQGLSLVTKAFSRDG